MIKMKMLVCLYINQIKEAGGIKPIQPICYISGYNSILTALNSLMDLF